TRMVDGRSFRQAIGYTGEWLIGPASLNCERTARCEGLVDVCHPVELGTLGTNVADIDKQARYDFTLHIQAPLLGVSIRVLLRHSIDGERDGWNSGEVRWKQTVQEYCWNLTGGVLEVVK